MNKTAMRKLLSVIGCFVLIAAMALNFTGCADNNISMETIVATETVGTAFTFVVTDLDGNETSFPITTDKTTVGAALLDEGLISGTDSEYGLMVDTVNGVKADWDADQTYWAFYIDGEYAMTGVDQTDITPGSTYSFVLTKG